MLIEGRNDMPSRSLFIALALCLSDRTAFISRFWFQLLPITASFFIFLHSSVPNYLRPFLRLPVCCRLRDSLFALHGRSGVRISGHPPEYLKSMLSTFSQVHLSWNPASLICSQCLRGSLVFSNDHSRVEVSEWNWSRSSSEISCPLHVVFMLVDGILGINKTVTD